jgi:ATP-dependent Clp protease ATP-binding subunit ClpA
MSVAEKRSEIKDSKAAIEKVEAKIEKVEHEIENEEDADEKKALREKEKQLRKEKEQLREEKILLLKQQQQQQQQQQPNGKFRCCFCILGFKWCFEYGNWFLRIENVLPFSRLKWNDASTFLLQLFSSHIKEFLTRNQT